MNTTERAATLSRESYVELVSGDFAPVSAEAAREAAFAAWRAQRDAKEGKPVAAAPQVSEWDSIKASLKPAAVEVVAEAAPAQVVEVAEVAVAPVAVVAAPSAHAVWVAARSVMAASYHTAGTNPTAANWEAAKAAAMTESAAYDALQASLAVPFKPCVHVPKVVKTKEQAFAEWGQRLNKSLRASNRRKAARA